MEVKRIYLLFFDAAFSALVCKIGPVASAFFGALELTSSLNNVRISRVCKFSVLKTTSLPSTETQV